MKLNLSNIHEAKTFTYTMKDVWLKEFTYELSSTESFNIEAPFEFNVKISPTISEDNTFILEVKAHGILKTACSRCLTDFNYKLKEQTLFTSKNIKENETNLPNKETYMSHQDQEDEDISNFPIVNKQLNLKDLLREIIFLNLPCAFICYDDCKGLCTQCGCNKNIETCKCNQETLHNNQFEILKTISQNGG